MQRLFFVSFIMIRLMALTACSVNLKPSVIDQPPFINQFHPSLFEAESTFFRNARGEVDQLVMLQFGVTTEAKKVP